MNNDTPADAITQEKCPKCEGYGYDIFPEVDCDVCLGKATVSSAKANEQGVLRIVDSCGGAEAIGESADWNRGYNDALAAVDRELKRYFARTTSLAAQDGLVEALRKFMPTNINLDNKNVSDKAVIPLDVTMGELRAIAAALASIEVKS